MIDMYSALWDLLRSSIICLIKGIVGLVMVAAVVAIPILIAGIIWKVFCIIFALEFSWSVPIVLVGLAICYIVTAEEE